MRDRPPPPVRRHHRPGPVRWPAAVAVCGAALVLGMGAPAAALSAAPERPAQSFTSCAEAAASGFTNMAEGQPGYSPGLDANGDGIACGAGDSPSVSTPADSTPAESAPATPAPEVLGQRTEAAPANDELAATGAPSWALLLIAVALLAAGRHLVAIADDHLGWLTGRARSGVRFTVQPVRRRRGRSGR